MTDSSDEENAVGILRSDTSLSRYSILPDIPLAAKTKENPQETRTNNSDDTRIERSDTSLSQYSVLPNVPPRATLWENQEKVQPHESIPKSRTNPYEVLPAIGSERLYRPSSSYVHFEAMNSSRCSSVPSSSYVEFEATNPSKSIIGEEVFLKSIETTVLIKITTLLFNTNILVIVGKAGTGKTTIGHQLLYFYKDTFITNQVSSVTECLHTLKFNEDQFIFFDDVFGRDIHSFNNMKWKTFYQKWTDVENTKTKKSKRTILVMSSRSKLFFRNICFQFKLVDLDTEEHVLTIEDKANIFRFYLHESDNSSEPQTLQNDVGTITPSDMGFPLCSRLYSQYFHQIGITFVESPLQFLLQEYMSMVERYDEASCLSRIMAICNGTFETDNELANTDVMSVLPQQSFHQADILNFAKSLMEPFFNLSDTGVLQFVHPSLLTTSEIYFFNEDKGQAIKYISLVTIVTYVRSVPGRSVHQQIKYGDLQVKPLEMKDFTILAERLVHEILQGNVERVCTHKLLNNSVLVTKVSEFLKGKKNIEILINLFSVEDNIEGEGVIYWAAFYNKRIFCQKLLQLFAKCMNYDSNIFSEILSQALIGACLHKTEMILIFDLVKYGANINYCGECNTGVTNENMSNGRTRGSHLCPLEAVVRSENEHAFKYLLKKGARIPHSSWTRWDLISHIAQKSFDFIVALHLSFSTFDHNDNVMHSEDGKVAMIAKMLDKINARNLDNINEIFFVFLRHGYINPAICESFKLCGLNVNYFDKKNRNCIHAFLWEYENNPFLIPPDTIPCLRFLLTEKCDPNNVSIDGTFPLSLVIGKHACNIEIFEMLLTAGADPDKITPNGLTPLHLCIKSDMSEEDKLALVSLLVKFGCNLDILSRTGKSYGQILLQSQTFHSSILARVSKFPLHDCLLSKLNEADKIIIAKELVNTHNVDINVKDQKGRTALLISSTVIFSGPIAKSLLGQGANANILFQSNSSILQTLLQSRQRTVCDLLEILIANVDDIRHENEDGDTVIHTALQCTTKRYNEIKIVLRDCSLDILNHTNSNNQSVLHLCASCNGLDDSEALDMCETYLSVCSGVDEHDTFDKSPLEYAASCTKSRTQTISYLLEYSASFKNRDSFIIDLVKHGHICDKICTVLQEKDFLKSTVEEDERILLKLSSIAPKTRSQIEGLISKLCEAGADINKKDDDGNSPLIIACRQTMNIGLISALVHQGADVNLQNEHGNTALHECIVTASSDIVLNQICRIFANAGFDWSVRDSSGNSVLHCLIDNKLSAREQTFKTLSRSVNFNMVDLLGTSVLHKIVMLNENDVNVSKWLNIIFSTGFEIDTEIKESNGRTVLNLACCHDKYSRIHTILTLLNHGVDVNTFDEFGHSPLYNVINCLVGHDIITKFERFSRVWLLLISFNSNVVDTISDSPIDLSHKHGYYDIHSVLTNNRISNTTELLGNIVDKMLRKKQNVYTDVPRLSLDALSGEIGKLIQSGYRRVCRLKINVDDDINITSDYLSESTESPFQHKSLVLRPATAMQDMLLSRGFSAYDSLDEEQKSDFEEEYFAAYVSADENDDNS